MIIVKIWGGLGNQMFQYAAAKALSVKNNAALKLDISHFKHPPPGETIRSFRLDIFPNIHEEIATKEEIEKLVPYFTTPMWKTVYKKLNQHLYHFNKHYVIEPASAVPGLQLDHMSSVYLEGYWQSEHYFREQAAIIRDCFSLDHLFHLAPLHSYIDKISRENSVSLHIRRGDYITNQATGSFHGVLRLEYYEAALAELQRTLGRNLSLFIFSDDIEWCTRHLEIPFQHTYVSTGEDYYDLYLMSICKHHITANSSFSWWGAWLKTNPGKMVIAPAKWFSQKDSKDIIPVSWTTM